MYPFVYISIKACLVLFVFYIIRSISITNKMYKLLILSYFIFNLRWYISLYSIEI